MSKIEYSYRVVWPFRTLRRGRGYQLTHIVRVSRWGSMVNWAADKKCLCGVSPASRFETDVKLANASCARCVREWRSLVPADEAAPPELPDPVHHGDVFARIDAGSRS
jgi:hypothetical protein